MVERPYAPGGSGRHVGILITNCVAYQEILFAIHLAGGVAVPFNARFRHRELAFVIAHSDIEVLVTTDLADEHTDFAALLTQALPDLESQDDAKGDLHLTHEALIRSWSAYADLVGFEPDQSMWTPCPFFHVGGIGVTVSALVRGPR